MLDKRMGCFCDGVEEDALFCFMIPLLIWNYLFLAFTVL